MLKLTIIVILFTSLLYASSAADFTPFEYGQHYPNGKAAFDYITGPQGTWHQLPSLEYIWNYYDFPQPMPINHPYDKAALVTYADGSHFTTCRDANAHLLFDINHDGELDIIDYTQPPSNYAYHEHSGRGIDNKVFGNPFTNFWFDDNSLAKYV